MDLAALARERESRLAASRGVPVVPSTSPAASGSGAGRRTGVATLFNGPSTSSNGRAQAGSRRADTRGDAAAEPRQRGTLDYLAEQVGVSGKVVDVPALPALGFPTRTKVPMINLIVLGVVAAALLYKKVDALRVGLAVVAGLFMIVSQASAARRDERAEQ